MLNNLYISEDEASIIKNHIEGHDFAIDDSEDIIIDLLIKKLKILYPSLRTFYQNKEF